ncbi:hypothetical protein SKAU_G00318770 [Synaphobranchus kaupii]|uniref:Uncharacterized protein n=1 Tax=Synaphobranchus kaupii TaxID=118154 RepID=A0A9Q1ILS7_SYNKA|nr:hypothetical protein SKAU_G00318770 [Synaphobranchus kaupii]
MPKQKQKSGRQKRVEKKEREARSSTPGAQNITDFFSKKAATGSGIPQQFAVSQPCSSPPACLPISIQAPLQPFALLFSSLTD